MRISKGPNYLSGWNGDISPTMIRNWNLLIAGMRLWVVSLSEVLQASPQRGHHLDFGVVRAGTENLAKPYGCLIYRNWDIIYGCSFKPLSLYQFVTQQQKINIILEDGFCRYRQKKKQKQGSQLKENLWENIKGKSKRHKKCRKSWHLTPAIGRAIISILIAEEVQISM